MKIGLTYFFLFILLASCNRVSDKKAIQNKNSQLTKSFLSLNEWMIDSAQGSNEFLQDWIYFTPDSKFYRFSKFKESYIIDSALAWSGNEVLKNGIKVYEIFPIDSQQIEIKAGKRIYYAKRWSEFNEEDIERFIENNKSKLLINGKWHLDSVEIKTAEMPSYCKELHAGAIFDFKKEGELVVSPSAKAKACNQYSYQIYENEVSLTEYDMVLDFPIIKLSDSKMILKSRYTPKNIYFDENSDISKNGYSLYFSKM